MSASKLWSKKFRKKNLIMVFNRLNTKHLSVGLDRVTSNKFSNDFNENIAVIIRKINNGTFKFTRFREVLLIKNSIDSPRKISIPTIRDRIVISTINELLLDLYGKNAVTIPPQQAISYIQKEISKYDMYIKVDIKDFYGSIDHDILMSILMKKIRKPQILNAISNIIKNSSYNSILRTTSMALNSGIPQGLDISNTLANIFLIDFDECFKNNHNFLYIRYVDDILVLCKKESDVDQVFNEIYSQISLRKLEINSKSNKNKISSSFEYLGYQLSNTTTLVKQKSLTSIEQSLEKILFENRKESFKLIEWKLNLRITGFIVDKKRYGWVFFYSQISELKQLHHLDWLVKKLLKRYNLNNLHTKKFVKTLYEVKKINRVSKYVPDFDRFSQDDKKKVLIDVFNMKKIRDDEIDFEFNRLIAIEIVKFEKDSIHIS